MSLSANQVMTILRRDPNLFLKHHLDLTNENIRYVKIINELRQALQLITEDLRKYLNLNE